VVPLGGQRKTLLQGRITVLREQGNSLAPQPGESQRCYGWNVTRKLGIGPSGMAPELVALTVYRRGALEVLRRLQERAAEAAIERAQAEAGEGYPLTGDTDLW